MSPRRLQDVLKRCLQDMSWRDILKTSWKQTKFFLGISVSNYSLLTNLNKYLTNLYLANLHVSTCRLPRRLQDIFKASSRRLAGCLQDVFKTYLQDVLEEEIFLCWRRAEDVLKTCLEDQQMFAGKWSVTEHCVARFYWLYDRHFYMKIIVNLIPINLVTNVISAFFFVKWTKNKNHIFRKLVVW